MLSAIASAVLRLMPSSRSCAVLGVTSTPPRPDGDLRGGAQLADVPGGVEEDAVVVPAVDGVLLGQRPELT